MAKIISPAVRRNTVNIDVIVTDHNGKPVPNLATPDFELTLDGKPVAISACTPPESEAAGDTTTPPTRTRALTLAIFVDQRNLSPADRRDFVEQLALLVNDQLDTQDRVLIASLEPGRRFRKTWVSDPQSIALTLGEMSEFDPDDIARARRAPDEIAPMKDDSTDYLEVIKLMQPWPKDSDNTMLQAFGENQGPILAARGFRESALFSTLVRTIDSLAIAPGHKLLLFFSREVAGTIDRDLVEILPADEGIQDLIHRATAGRIALYPISATAIPPAKMRENSLVTLARTTGGRCLTTSPALEDEVITILQNHATSYTLTFATDHAGDGKFHKISVRPTKPNLSIQYPEGYWDRRTEENLAFLTRAVLRGDYRENPLRISAHLGTVVSRKKTYLLPITLTIPTDLLSFVPSEEAYHASLVTGISIANPRSRVFEEFSKTSFVIDIPKPEFGGKKQHVTTIELSLKVLPGPQRIAIVVSDEIAHRDSATILSIDVAEQ